MSGPPVDPATGRAVLGGRGRTALWRFRLVGVSAPFGTVTHLFDMLTPADRTRTLCGMVTGAHAQPSTCTATCRTCLRVHDRLIVQGGWT